MRTVSQSVSQSASQSAHLGAHGSSKLRRWTVLGLQNVVLDSLGVSKLTSWNALGVHVGVLEGLWASNLGSGIVLDVQVGVLGTLWASKLESRGGFGQPNEAPKESFGPPKLVGRRLRMHFCNVMKNLEKPKENLGFCYVSLAPESLRKALTSMLSS